MAVMEKVSDYLARRFAELGVTHVFMITGGEAMHLDDSFGRRADLTLLISHHEQACVMGVEGYAGPRRSGCGRLDDGPRRYEHHHRRARTVARLGTRVLHLRAGLLRHGSEHRAAAAPVGRPVGRHRRHRDADREVRGDGHRPPVGSLPLREARAPGAQRTPRPRLARYPPNVQGALSDEGLLVGYEPEPAPLFGEELAALQIAEVVERLKTAQRPVVLAGSGIRTAGARHAFLVSGVPFAGFGTIMTVMLLMFGFLFTMLGIIAEYVGMIFGEVKQCPNFVVRNEIGQ